MRRPDLPDSSWTGTSLSVRADRRSSITNADKITRIVEDWRPNDIAFIRKLLFRSREDESGFDLEIEFVACPRSKQTRSWPWEAEPRYEVSLRFSRVRNLALSGLGTENDQVMGFDIIDISGRGWEGVRFEIEDYKVHLDAQCPDLPERWSGRRCRNCGRYRRRIPAREASVSSARG
jgi:hypothetical protein